MNYVNSGKPYSFVAALFLSAAFLSWTDSFAMGELCVEVKESITKNALCGFLASELSELEDSEVEEAIFRLSCETLLSGESQIKMLKDAPSNCTSSLGTEINISTGIPVFVGNPNSCITEIRNMPSIEIELACKENNDTPNLCLTAIRAVDIGSITVCDVDFLFDQEDINDGDEANECVFREASEDCEFLTHSVTSSENPVPESCNFMKIPTAADDECVVYNLSALSDDRAGDNPNQGDDDESTQIEDDTQLIAIIAGLGGLCLVLLGSTLYFFKFRSAKTEEKYPMAAVAVNVDILTDGHSNANVAQFVDMAENFERNREGNDIVVAEETDAKIDNIAHCL